MSTDNQEPSFLAILQAQEEAERRSSEATTVLDFYRALDNVLAVAALDNHARCEWEARREAF